MKRVAFIVIAAILFAIPSLCGAMDFYPLPPDKEAKIQALKEKVKAKGGTYEVEYSAATDRDLSQLTGLKMPTGWNKSDAPSVQMLDSTVQTLPSSFSWMSNGVTPIKDQGNCGACWAFSTVGPLESQILLQGGGTVDLSEQYLISCNVDGWNCPNGGWFAHDYHMDKSGQDNNVPGAVLAAEKPYTGTDSACGETYDHPYTISNWAYIGSESAVPSTDAIKQAIYTYGPVSVAICAQELFQNYSGGIFNTSESCGSDVINHAVVLVGWNDNNGNGYWILRNSWGTSWGMSGYMYIGYGVSQVGYGANFIEYADGTPAPAPSTVVYDPNLTGAFPILHTSRKGKTVTGIFQVQNMGNEATSTWFRVLLYLSPDGVNKSRLLGSSKITKHVPAGGIVNLRISKTYAKSVIGQHVIAVVDPDSRVPDSNRTNSVVVSSVLEP